MPTHSHRGVVIFTFSIPTSNFFYDASEFSVCSYCFDFILLKVQINFYISTFVLSNCYSSFVHVTFRSFRNIQRATRISVCVTVVCNSHKFFFESSFIFLFFSTTTPTPSHQRVIIFSTTMQGFYFDDESMFFNDVEHYSVLICGSATWYRFSLDSHFSWTISRDLFVCRNSPSLQCHLVEYVISSNMAVTAEC